VSVPVCVVTAVRDGSRSLNRGAATTATTMATAAMATHIQPIFDRAAGCGAGRRKSERLVSDGIGRDI
jgi:hypothetical protein